MKRRPAANKYRLSAIASAWKVSERAVLDAGAILGFKFIGAWIYALREEVMPGSVFQLEATLSEKMLARRRGRMGMPQQRKGN